MSNLIPFDSAPSTKLTVAIPKDLFNVEDMLTGMSRGFPVISIEGKNWSIKRGDTKEIIRRPNVDGELEPARSIEVVILRANKGTAKVFYAKKYTQGSVEKPDCYSNDGVAPAADAVNAQAKKCAACPHNQWGSRITDEGKKAKACSDVKRLAVAAPDALNDPMLLRVPATSLGNWDEFVKFVAGRGYAPIQCKTRISFDPEATHQLLQFKPLGVFGDDVVAEAVQVASTQTVEDIIGGTPTAAEETNGSAHEAAPKAAAKPAPVEEEAPAPAPKKSAKLAAVVEDAEAAPKAKVKVEAEVEEEAPAPAPKKAAKVVEVDDDITAGLDDMLSDLGFDDEE